MKKKGKSITSWGFLVVTLVVGFIFGLLFGAILWRQKGKDKEDENFAPHEHIFQKASLIEHSYQDGIYYGEWEANQPEGCGVLVQSSGMVFAGHWHNGRQEGIFRIKHPNDSVSFSKWSKGVSVCNVDTVMHENCYGVDLSKYQYGYWSAMMIENVKDENQVEYTPVNFVIIKASQGIKGKDTQYDFHSKMAELMSICQGAYHVFDPSVNAEEQVISFVSSIQNHQIDGPLVLDIEGSTLEVSKKLFAKMKPVISAWLKRVESELSRKPIIYCCNDFFKHYGKDEVFNHYQFWIADYSGKQPLNDWIIHQYTDKGRVVDWPYPVDLDYSRN